MFPDVRRFENFLSLAWIWAWISNFNALCLVSFEGIGFFA
jgi:hypothetical protein